MRHYIFASIIAFASFAAVSACNFKLGDDTEGENGKLRFSYSGSGCLFGCSLDRQALQGGTVTVLVSGGDSTSPRAARMQAGGILSVTSQLETCSCWIDHESRSIRPDDKCAGGETRKCQMSVDLVAVREGEGKLEITSGSTVIDLVTVHVRPGARIVPSVKAADQVITPGPDGVYEVKQNARIAVESKVYGAEDQELFFTKSGVHHSYGNENVVTPAGSGWLGLADIENMNAKEPGTATVTIEAVGAKTLTTFRVVP